MPRELEACVSHVRKRGKSKSSAFAICRSSLGSDADIYRRRRKKKKRGKPKRKHD